ncbi:uncharacterized protein LOC107627282 [Arachis ipaensis]|uniref:uncharacterized protein LOC107627282 n=1 Tax=Arachis ipaensis TaxID=130454 RepID=UPI0007AF155F|nr:uncharacterized protein LOC107627282 [Arachis ipaensis]XP_025635970.1 uncharacterized protein LOC112730071 [Arachis hypogaea]
MEKMMKHQELANKNYEASLRNLERQIGPLSKQPTERPTNTFPSDTIPNPKEECKAIQHRRGRTLENDKVDSKVTAEEKDQEKLKKKEEEPQAPRKANQVMEEHPQEQRKEVKPYIPPLPYPQRLQRELKDQQFLKFLEVFKKLEINLPLAEALEQMPLYEKFLKELINKKRSWNEKETVILTQECSAVIQKGLPPKLKDPGSFILPCTISNMSIDKALCDLGSSINLMLLSMTRRLSIEEVKPTWMSLQLAERSMVIPNGVVENLLVKVGNFIFPANFLILDLDEEGGDSIILGRSFLGTTRAIIDVKKGEMTLRTHNEQIILNVFKEMQHPVEKKGCMRIEEEDLNWKEKPKEALFNSPLVQKTDIEEKQKGHEDKKVEKELQKVVTRLIIKKKAPDIRPAFKREGDYSSKHRKKAHSERGQVEAL